MNDLNILKVFEAVISTGSVNGAAKKLNITSPAVSQSLNKLREIYPDPLFIKDGRGLKATNYALQLYDNIKEPLALLINSVDLNGKFDPFTSQRTFKITTHADLDLLFFSKIFNEIKEEAPNIKLEIITDHNDTENIQDMLRMREAEIAITTAEMNDKSYNNELIKEESLVLLARKGHPNVINGEVSFEDFFNGEHATLKLRRKLGSMTVESLAKTELPERKSVYESDSIYNLIFTISKTDLFCVANKSFFTTLNDLDLVQTAKVPFECSPVPIYMTSHKILNKDEGVQWLKDKIRRAFEE